ncbi:MAG: hypothetical protein RPU52_11985 [Candidatus Sedimenticola sp. (ex Thyasira tokunagai)]
MMVIEKKCRPHGFLTSLIKRQEWDLERLGGEIYCATSALIQLTDESQEIASEVTKQSELLLEFQTEGKIMILAQVWQTKEYVDLITEKLRKKENERLQAEKMAAQLTSEYATQKERLRVMKDMLSTRESEFQSEKVREMELEVDDLWSQRKYVS